MKRSIVIIEDDADIAQSIRYNLEQEGSFQVTITTTGEAGLRTVLEHPPNLILLDLNLPLMNGFEICRRLRREEATAHVPIIMLTARTDETDKIHGLGLGADDYVTKPFSVRELMAALTPFCAGRKAAHPPSMMTGHCLLTTTTSLSGVRGRKSA